MSSKHLRKLFVKPMGRPNNEINVTPLVDVVLVLLIIFMVVTPLLEKDIAVTVPSTEKVEEVTEIPPDQLVVKVAADGKLLLNSVAIEESDYVNRLTSRLASHGPSDKVVFFVADENANYGRFVNAIDGAKRAGAEVIGIATDPPEVK